jgi:hypothetical protein
MARASKKIGPLFPVEQKPDESEEKNKTAEPQPVQTQEEEVEEKKEEGRRPRVMMDNDPEEEQDNGLLSKYKKREPKYKTHVPHNVRIPKELRRDIDMIAKKLGIPIHKNSGFLQQFTIDALKVHVEKAKKELDIE